MRLIDMLKSLDARNVFFLTIGLLISVDLVTLFDILFLRQIIGFLFLTILPGLLILRVLKLNRINYIEKFVLSVGLSISFLMLFGLFVNYLLISIGYKTPLETISLLLSFNLAFIVLAIIGYKLNRDQIFSFPNLYLSTSEKAFLNIPILFPALSIFGMHIMNITDNNNILMLLLFLIPFYVALIFIFNRYFSERLYKVIIFLISISLLLLLSLRSNHLLGCDTHLEYYLFQITADNLYWNIFAHTSLDACLSISLLPTIYLSILNISQELLFKILYSLIYSITPLVVYIISRKYIGESYAFLASFFFMSQGLFLDTAANSRTSIAILFFSLAMMTLFNDKIDLIKKRFLLIVFVISCIVSHYSTAYIFFFILLTSFLLIEILSKKYKFKRTISLILVILFISTIFLWYSQVTKTAFNAGVGFIEDTFINLNGIFIEESRSEITRSMVGAELGQQNIAYKFNFIFNWISIFLIGIGILTLIRRYKEMSFSGLNFAKDDFLIDRFEIEYFVVAIVCVGLLASVVMLPFLTFGYDMSRPYAAAIVILSIFFVIGGIIIAKYLNQLIEILQGKALSRNTSQRWAHFIILFVLIPYFFAATGVSYQMIGSSDRVKVTLNSGGSYYDGQYIHDQESYCAKWLREHVIDQDVPIYTDHNGMYFLTSQGRISRNQINAGGTIVPSFQKYGRINGYVFLRYQNIVKGELLADKIYSMKDFLEIFERMNKTYASGYSEVYR